MLSESREFYFEIYDSIFLQGDESFDLYFCEFSSYETKKMRLKSLLPSIIPASMDASKMHL